MSFAVFTLGFTALVSQALLLRELLAAFGGQELSLGIALAGWLLLVGVGAAVTGWMAERLKWGVGALAAAHCALAILLLLELLTARQVKERMGLSVFDLTDFITTSLTSLFLLAPLCLLLGGQFALACRAVAIADCGLRIADLPNAVGRVYLYESIGALVGGMVFSFVLITALDPLPTAGLLGLLNLIAAFLLIVPNPIHHSPATGWQRRAAPTVIRTVLLILSVGFIIFFITTSRRLERASLQRQWRGLRVMDSRRSPYGHLVVTERHGSYSFYENGLLLFSLPSAMECEETAHYALLQHPAPRRVLIIGGGVSGLLRETLRHPVERVDYVELDPFLISLARRYVDARDRRALNDRRVQVWHTDGRLFVQNAPLIETELHSVSQDGRSSTPPIRGDGVRLRRHRCYDVVIVNLPDPLTAQLNRFYTVEFAQAVKRILQPNGLVAWGLSSGETYRAPETRLLNACLYNTLRRVFADCLVVPGERAMFLASPTKGVLTSDLQTLAQRFQQRRLTLDYLTPFDFELRLASERLDELRREFAENTHVPVNRDLKPICYYYNMQREAAQWQTGKWKMENGKWKSMFHALFFSFASRLSLWWFAAPLMLTCCLWLGAQRRRQRKVENGEWKMENGNVKSHPPSFSIFHFPFFILHASRVALLWALFCSGFAAMALEVVLLLAFQSFYGYVYHQVCLLVTAFMAGMAVGAWIAQRMGGRRREADATRNTHHASRNTQCLLIVQLLLIIYALLLPLQLRWFSPLTTHHSPLTNAGNAWFLLSLAICGALVGAAFPLASAAWARLSPDGAARAGGALYAADLAGACVGALLVSATMLPLWGVHQTCWGVALLCLSALPLLIALPPTKRNPQDNKEESTGESA